MCPDLIESWGGGRRGEGGGTYLLFLLDVVDLKTFREKIQLFKGLSYEIDFENVDEN